MYNLRDIFTVNTKKQLYNSFIFPYIDYCVEAWGRTYQSNVNLVYIIVYISNKKNFQHTS